MRYRKLCDDFETVFSCYFLVILRTKNSIGVDKYYRAKPKGEKNCNKFLITKNKATELTNYAKAKLHIEKERAEKKAKQQQNNNKVYNN